MNVIREAVDSFGRRGVEQVAIICDVTGATVYNWLRTGRITEAVSAVRLYRALRARGSDISLERLIGLDDRDGEAPIPSGKRPGARQLGATAGAVSVPEAAGGEVAHVTRGRKVWPPRSSR